MVSERVETRIRGISPLLMHRFPIEPVAAIEKKSQEEQAEIAAYRKTSGGALYPRDRDPTRSHRSSGPTRREKGGQASRNQWRRVCTSIPISVVLARRNMRSMPERLSFRRRRAVLCGSDRAWTSGRFRSPLDYDPDLLTEEQLRIVVDDAGARVGLLDFRPERKGPFGRFMVVEWG